MKKARAMYIPAGGKTAVWGPVDHNVLPEGYPYKEGSKTVIEWDGNTEGKVDLGSLTKVSDLTPSIEELKPAFVSTSIGDDAPSEVTGTIIAMTDKLVGETGGSFMVVYEDNYTLHDEVSGQDVTFPEKGIYFGSVGHYGRTKYMVYGTETIHTMSPEFLPAGVGGGGVLRVNVTAVDGDVTNLTADKTYAEIVSAFEAGSVITAYFVLDAGYVFTLSQRGESNFLFHSIFTMSGSPVPMFLQIRNDDDVMLIESAFS